MGLAADDPESQARLAAFAQGLQQSGWSIGQNLWIDYRWGGGDPENMRKYAADLVALAPDVILAHSSACRRQLCWAASLAMRLDWSGLAVTSSKAGAIDRGKSEAYTAFRKPTRCGWSATAFHADSLHTASHIITRGESRGQDHPRVQRTSIEISPVVEFAAGRGPKTGKFHPEITKQSD
jgi:hypothetical protein